MTEQERIALVSDCISFLANMWVRWLRPVPIDRTFIVNGIRVRVIVEEHKTVHDTLPLRRAGEGAEVDIANLRASLLEDLQSDRSQDA